MDKLQKNRANSLLSAYRQTDRKYGYGKGDLTTEWIVKHIFSQPCVHCGETDWHKLGCNRIDNNKPHSIDNVEPCCSKCNRKLPRINARYSKKYIPMYEKKACTFVDILKNNIGIYNYIAEAYVY